MTTETTTPTNPTVHAPEWQPSDRVPEKDRGI